MKFLRKALLAITLFISVATSGQVAFEKVYDFYVNSWTSLVFAQDDGYLIPTYGVTDKYYLCLLKTDLKGNFLWKKEFDYGDLKYIELMGTQDSLGNIYLQSGDYQNKLIKFDKDGNEQWVRAYSCVNEQNMIVKDSILWMAGEVNNNSYLYKIDANTGDSLNRYLIAEFIPGSETTSACTSLVVTGNNDVVITVTKRNYHVGVTMNTEFYKLPYNSSQVETFTVNVPTTQFLVFESRVQNDEIICLGEWIEWFNNTSYLFRYKSDGTITSFASYDFGYYYDELHTFTVNNKNEVIALGMTENEQGTRNIMLKAFSPTGDSLWTQFVNTTATGLDIRATADNGCIIAGNMKAGNQYLPYLLKTFRRIILPADSSDVVEPLVMNPVRGKAFFDTREMSDGEIIICNQSGRLVNKLVITCDVTIWDSNQMEPGLYFYTLISGSKKISGKVIVSP